ncbi:MAG: succinylglutamate desuccinylase/aspartoacylase family protein [Oceanospirillaceae bacterium]
MSHKVEKIALKSPSPGTRRFLTVHTFESNKEGPKVYLQAALHADEWPGLLALQHLLESLIDLDKEGKLRGTIVVVPYANPIGMDQKINGTVLGRQSFSAEGNFNRHWPDLSNVVTDLMENKQSVSVAKIRSALLASVAQLPTHTPLNQLKATLLSLSIDADYVLDVHCDSEALVHIYGNYRHQEQLAVLAQYMRSPVILLEDEPGGSPFDAAHVLPWIAAEKNGIAASCFSTTIELRGFADVSDELAIQDAQGLLGFLASQGVVDIEKKTIAPFMSTATNLDAVDSVMAPSSGIISWKVSVGDVVKKQQLIAEIVDIESENPQNSRTPIYSRTCGMLFARAMGKLVSEGDNVGKIAGSETLETVGGLLTL